MFPIFGFGGIPAGTASVSHLFPLAPGPVAGVAGMLDAYQRAVASTRLSGPTIVSVDLSLLLLAVLYCF